MSEQSTSEAASVAPVGTRARRGFANKHLIPSTDWIMTEVVSKGKGTKVIIGRVYGVATGAEQKENEFGGKILTSVVLQGSFEAESYVTGEITYTSSVYPPGAYADIVMAMFAADSALKNVEIDYDVCLEATGKPIPYEFFAEAYNDGREMAILKRLRLSRARPATAPALLASEAPAALEGPPPSKK
jgi:hypothetical protein